MSEAEADMADDDDQPDTSTTEATSSPDTGDEVAKWKEMARKHEDAAKTASRRLAAIERAQMTDAERVQAEHQAAIERATQAEQRASDMETAYLRLKVASTKGLPGELAERLRGASEKEMTADADRLLALFPARRNGTDVPLGPQGTASEMSMNDVIRQMAGR